MSRKEAKNSQIKKSRSSKEHRASFILEREKKEKISKSQQEIKGLQRSSTSGDRSSIIISPINTITHTNTNHNNHNII